MREDRNVGTGRSGRGLRVVDEIDVPATPHHDGVPRSVLCLMPRHDRVRLGRIRTGTTMQPGVDAAWEAEAATSRHALQRRASTSEDHAQQSKLFVPSTPEEFGAIRRLVVRGDD